MNYKNNKKFFLHINYKKYELMINMKKQLHKDPHAILTLKVARWLKEENPDDEIGIYFKKKVPKMILTNGKEYFPDLWNKTKKIVYEMHYRGQRKGEEFENLPNGWKGVNIFYDERDNPETIVIKFKGYEIKKIKWD